MNCLVTPTSAAYLQLTSYSTMAYVSSLLQEESRRAQAVSLQGRLEVSHCEPQQVVGESEEQPTGVEIVTAPSPAEEQTLTAASLSSSSLPAQAEVNEEELTRASKTAQRRSWQSSNKPYVCPYPGCTRSYFYQHDVKRHIKQQHSGAALPVDVTGTSQLTADSQTLRLADDDSSRSSAKSEEYTSTMVAIPSSATFIPVAAHAQMVQVPVPTHAEIVSVPAEASVLTVAAHAETVPISAHASLLQPIPAHANLLPAHAHASILPIPAHAHVVSVPSHSEIIHTTHQPISTIHSTAPTISRHTILPSYAVAFSHTLAESQFKPDGNPQHKPDESQQDKQ